MRRTILIYQQNEELFNLLDNKTEFFNKVLSDLHNEIMRRKAIFQAKSEKFQAGGTIPKESPMTICSGGVRYALLDYGINPRFLTQDFEDLLLAKMLLTDKIGKKEMTGEL